MATWVQQLGSANEGTREVLNSGQWAFSRLGPGGREIHVSLITGAIAYTARSTKMFES